jgi:hypothetical protein
MDAAELVAAARTELAPVECRLAEHRYLGELDAGRVPLESLRAFAGEQRLIVTSDRRSFEHLAHRFPQPPASDFFREMAVGEAEALRLLEPFATAVVWVPRTWLEVYRSSLGGVRRAICEPSKTSPRRVRLSEFTRARKYQITPNLARHGLVRQRAER